MLITMILAMRMIMIMVIVMIMIMDNHYLYRRYIIMIIIITTIITTATSGPAQLSHRLERTGWLAGRLGPLKPQLVSK